MAKVIYIYIYLSCSRTRNTLEHRISVFLERVPSNARTHVPFTKLSTRTRRTHVRTHEHNSNTEHVEHSSVTNTSNTLWTQHSDSGPRYSHIDQYRCPCQTADIFEHSAEHNRTPARTHILNVWPARGHPGSRPFTLHLNLEMFKIFWGPPISR